MNVNYGTVRKKEHMACGVYYGKLVSKPWLWWG